MAGTILPPGDPVVNLQLEEAHKNRLVSPEGTRHLL